MKITCNSCSKENKETIDFKTWEDSHIFCSKCKKRLYKTTYKNKTIYQHLDDIISYADKINGE